MSCQTKILYQFFLKIKKSPLGKVGKYKNPNKIFIKNIVSKLFKKSNFYEKFSSTWRFFWKTIWKNLSNLERPTTTIWYQILLGNHLWIRHQGCCWTIWRYLLASLWSILKKDMSDKTSFKWVSDVLLYQTQK